MAKAAINLNYQTPERFGKDFAQLSKGKLFLPSKSPLPEKTSLLLNITLPEIDQCFEIDGSVYKVINSETAARLNVPPGMLIALSEGAKAVQKDIIPALRSNEQYHNLLASSQSTADAEVKPNAKPPVINTVDPADQIPQKKSKPVSEADTAAPTVEPIRSDTPDAAQPSRTEVKPEATGSAPKHVELAAKSLEADSRIEANETGDALTIEWIRTAIEQEEAAREKAPEPEITVAPTSEKNKLTPAEREKVKPAAEFLMNLTKAMLRSGYYSTDHPGAQNAKQGLFQEFQTCLGDSREIMINNQETRQQSDILITGILDEPVNVKTLVGAGMAELFVPKLREYFNRKGLISFAVKNDITLEHFESFVDIMSDPQADRGENTKVGELLSTALVEQGVTEISTVFIDDLIALELNLPWRVEMAIQRLAKDLKVLPMFKKESDHVIGNLKLQIIQDILRPLKHPEFLKDLIINCYIIAQHVQSVETEDIEKVIIDAFPLDTLLPTSRFIFEELNQLRELNKENPESPILKRRFAGVKRILKWVSSRLVKADVRGAQSFLEQLYLNKVLTFEDLPTDVQYLVNTDKMAKDVHKHVRNYISRLQTAQTPDDATVLLKCFRRVIPVLIEQKDWRLVLWLTKAADKAMNELNVFAPGPDQSFNPVQFMFKNRTQELLAGYEEGDEAQRELIENITDHMGPQGIEVLSKILSDSDNRSARKAAMEALIKKGDLSRNWILKVLDDPQQKWFLKRNALMLLSYVGKNEDEIDRARRHAAHEHPRVRDEAINVLVQLKAKGIEPLVIAALNDHDDKVRWRAMNAIGEISPFSQESIQGLLTIIKSEPPEGKQAAIRHYHKVAQLIRAIGVMKGTAEVDAVEDCILEATQKATGPKKGLLNRLKKSTDADPALVLSDGINTLGKIGTAKSETFLENLAAGKSPQAEAAQKAANDIKLRHLEQLSNAPANAAPLQSE